jgi:transposase-like protein
VVRAVKEHDRWYPGDESLLPATRERAARTQLGYRTFPTDIILQVVLWRLRYKLSLRDLAEMFLERGLVFTQYAVRAWEARFAPLRADQLRAKRTGQAGRSWHAERRHRLVAGTTALHARLLGV